MRFMTSAFCSGLRRSGAFEFKGPVIKTDIYSRFLKQSKTGTFVRHLSLRSFAMATSSYKYVVLGGGNAGGYAAAEFVKRGGGKDELAIITDEPVGHCLLAAARSVGQPSA